MKTRLIDILGNRFGRLVVVGRTSRDTYGRLRWDCVCDCGNKCAVDGPQLRLGYVKSCGCWRVDNSRSKAMIHGGTIGNELKREWSAWYEARRRCLNSNNKAFKHYGGRGISMCPEWSESFPRFLHDMGRCPDGLTIERMNNDKGYEPGNCIWATMKQQQNNRSNNLRITLFGITKTCSQWSDILGIPYNKLRNIYRARFGL